MSRWPNTDPAKPERHCVSSEKIFSASTFVAPARNGPKDGNILRYAEAKGFDD